MHQAWFGASDEARAALEAVGAEKNNDGSFKVRMGPPAIFGIGGDEVVIPVETEVQVPTKDGKGREWVKAVSVLPGGVKIMVIA
jgi:hypothetical protein